MQDNVSPLNFEVTRTLLDGSTLGGYVQPQNWLYEPLSIMGGGKLTSGFSTFMKTAT